MRDARVDLDDIDDLRRGLLERDLLIERLRAELVLAERWLATVTSHAEELLATTESAQSTLLGIGGLLPRDLSLRGEIDDLRHLLGED
jgi:hypothetical protein